MTIYEYHLLLPLMTNQAASILKSISNHCPLITKTNHYLKSVLLISISISDYLRSVKFIFSRLCPVNLKFHPVPFPYVPYRVVGVEIKRFPLTDFIHRRYVIHRIPRRRNIVVDRLEFWILIRYESVCRLWLRIWERNGPL